jgi:TPR repeat protein
MRERWLRLSHAPLVLWAALFCPASWFGQDVGLAKSPPANQTPAVTEVERKSLVAGLKTMKAEDITDLLRNAEAGDAKAQWVLGVAYSDGKIVAKDPARSWSWFQKSAAKNWPVGQNAVGIAYRRGLGVERNEVEALSWFRKAAEQGYAQAEANLGIAYYDGLGVPRDTTEAVKWFRKAVEQDNGFGQFWLGVSYAEGQGVASNFGEAASWFRKAADQGEVRAEYNLARLYDNGLGVPKDHAEAAQWYQKAAEHGDAQAQFDVAIAYHNGEGVPKSMEQAETRFTKASDAGWAPASFYLGKMYVDKKFQTSSLTGEVALKFFEKSAEQGYPLGALELADIYSNRFVAYHLWISRDEAKACQWLLVARELSKQDRWASSMPQDSATVKKELPKRITGSEKKLKEGFAACEQSAQEWMRARPSSLTP